MQFVDLEGIDHDALVPEESWLAMLAIAEKHGWENEPPDSVYFHPWFTLSLPQWALPKADDFNKVAGGDDARRFARELRNAIGRQAKKPPRWWNRKRKDRHDTWQQLTAKAWEVIYLFGAGTVRLHYRETEEPDGCDQASKACP